MKDRIQLYKEQIDIEEQIIKASKKSLEGVKNEFVKDLIFSINYDSHKHKRLLKGLVSKYEDSQPFVPEELSDRIKENIRKHMLLEADAIKSYKKILQKLEQDPEGNKQEITVIKAVLFDELRHHDLLLRIHKYVVQEETLTADDLFDMIWEESPSYSGAPLGP